MNLLLALLLVLPVSTDSLHVEAEDAHLTGNATVEATREGYLGSGYVTGLDAPGDSLRFEVETGEGLYSLHLGLAASGRLVSVHTWVDGEHLEAKAVGTGGRFGRLKVGEVLLPVGQHTIIVQGDIDVDYLQLVRRTYDGPPVPTDGLSDPDASEEAQALYQLLLDQYGEHILSGQQELSEVRYIEDVTGKTPAIAMGDLIEYSPSRRERGVNPENSSNYASVTDLIGWAGTDGILSVMWHWNAPTGIIETDPDTGNPAWYGGFYTRNTTFNFAEALADPASDEYALLLRDIDAIAEQLQRFEEAGQPILWRPLHEAAGGWFWWGAQGAEPFVELWRLLYDRLVNHHDLHNLIWVYTHEPGAAAWYPGDAYVDVVSVDVYADSQTATMKSEWDELQQDYGARKLIALSESGTLPDPEVITAYGIWWSWFSLWSGSFIRDVDPDYLRRVFTSDVVMTRDELPDWRPEPGLGIVSFTADPSAVEAGGASTLRWTVTGAATVTLDEAPVAASGTLKVTPQATTTYTLAVADSEGATDTMRVTVEVVDPSEINRARQQPAVASTVQNCCDEPVRVAANAVDGSPTTRWSSAWHDDDPNLDDDPDDEWIYVDLGATYDIAEVLMRWEAAHAVDYDIEVSNDGYRWVTVREVRGSDGDVDSISFAGVDGEVNVLPYGRYVRMHGLARTTIEGEQYGYSLFEFEVYGTRSAWVLPAVELAGAHEGVFVAPGGDLTLKANASDGDGTVQHVSFYLDGDSVTTDDEAPYQATLTGLSEGTHEVAAVVTDDDGLRVQSAPYVFYAMDTGGFFRFEAEDASFEGAVTEATSSSASGGVYLDMSGDAASGTITFDQIKAPEAGDYVLAFGYNLAYDVPKSQFVVVNGDTLNELRFDGPAETWLERGLEVPLREGANTVAIGWSWGWMYFDYLAVEGVRSTSAEGGAELPAAVTLGTSYPNPFADRTVVPFALPETAHIRLDVFDLTGRRIAVLVDGMQPAGRHTATLDGAGLASGVYVVRLAAGSTVRTHPVVLMR